MNQAQPTVAIIDYGLGNIFSIQQACLQVGLRPVITSQGEEILKADALILPGVGAFGKAMTTLQEMGLIPVLHDFAGSGRPFWGICLGLQLLFETSFEFGAHQGLGLIPGTVQRIPDAIVQGRRLKIPHVGWNRITPAHGGQDAWRHSPLAGLAAGDYLYFVHSFTVLPAEREWSLSMTTYGSYEFCSSIRKNNIFACQFHPEKSGSRGLLIYQNLAARLTGVR